MTLQDYLKKIPYLSLISRIGVKIRINIWLVGGFLRDVYLKKRKVFLDFDFCVEKDVFSIAKQFAREVSSKIITLDEKQGSFRVIVKYKGMIYTYDFTLMRGESFKEDLSLRDFTINTLALNLNDKNKILLDYLGARKDIDRKILRSVKEEVFLDDPLRILRAFSFMANYGFHLDKKTKDAIEKYRNILKNVSGERINEELFKIFSSDNSYFVISKMDNSGILSEIIPYIDKGRGVFQGGYHHLDVWQHSLETLRQFEIFYRRKLCKDKDIFDYLNEELAGLRKRIHIIKLACLLHDIGKPLAKKEKDKKTIFHTHEKIGRDLAHQIALKLRFSFKEREFLKKLIFWHLRPGYLAGEKSPSHRAIYRFFHDTEEEGVGVIILSLSDWRATRGVLIDEKRRKKHERVMVDLIDRYFAEKKKVPLPKIIDGYDIMRKFKLSPSPLIGKILKKVREEQALGKVSTKDEAYKAAKKIIAKDNR